MINAITIPIIPMSSFLLIGSAFFFGISLGLKIAKILDKKRLNKD
tara:strand:+ start:321 stop:455 length:135 start_codon:yes stop_codon:yes gene_type:complete